MLSGVKEPRPTGMRGGFGDSEAFPRLANQGRCTSAPNLEALQAPLSPPAGDFTCADVGGAVSRRPASVASMSSMGRCSSVTSMGPRSSLKEEDANNRFNQIARSLNVRYFPHVSANRGELRLSGPAALLQSIDPAKDKGFVDPHFEAPKHRFAAVKDEFGGKLVVPSRGRKWTSDLAWNDPANHMSMKVTHSVGGRHSATSHSMASATLGGFGGGFGRGGMGRSQTMR